MIVGILCSLYFLLYADDVLAKGAYCGGLNTAAHMNRLKKPNILFIVVDDLRPSLGCYSNDVMVTPNVDNLAKKSLLFTRAYSQIKSQIDTYTLPGLEIHHATEVSLKVYCFQTFPNLVDQYALCGPSRASFLTSRRPDTTRVYDQTHYWRLKGGNYTTLPQHFKENGYFTASVGKVFHPGPASGKDDDLKYSWSVPAYHPSTENYRLAKVCLGPDGKKYMNLVCPVNVTEQPGGTLPDIQSTEYAIEFLGNVSQQKIKQPFFLAVGFHKPHIPLKYPQQYLDLYPMENIHLPKDHTFPPRLPLVAWNPWTDLRSRDDVKRLNVSFPFGPLPEDFQLSIIQSYYAATTYMDDLLGHLLSTLDQFGLADNTIVSFMGDHGWSLGEHQEWSKFSNFEVAVRVPLMFYIPGITAPTVPRGHTFPYHRPFGNESKKKVNSGLPLQYKNVKYTEKMENDYLQSKDSDSFHDNSSFIIKLTESVKKSCEGCLMQQNLRSDAFVELVDIFPTLSELAGLTVPPLCPKNSYNTILCTEGSTLVPLMQTLLLESPSNSLHWKNASFSQYPRPSVVPQNNSDQPKMDNISIMGYSMRSNEYRYTEWIEFNPRTFTSNWNNVHARELYLYKSDYDDENNNVAGLPKYDKLVHELSRTLKAGWRSALPTKTSAQ